MQQVWGGPTLENRESKLEIYRLHCSCPSELHRALYVIAAGYDATDCLSGSLEKHLEGRRFENSEQVEMALGCTRV